MADTLLLVIRWLHAIAAVAWVGGGIFYWIVLRPAQRAGMVPAPLARFAGIEFSSLVALCIGVLALTGAILGVQRLSEAVAGVPYFVTLAVKVALSAWMFFLVVARRGRGGPKPAGRSRLQGMIDGLGHVNMTVVLGAVIFLISDVLRYLVERALAG
ncbi:MAG: hypothetical protein FJ318_09435 [SAR202 cluster bacterium]|nr:hypothetical protein [SAR202 cluster bacterium]